MNGYLNMPDVRGEMALFVDLDRYFPGRVGSGAMPDLRPGVIAGDPAWPATDRAVVESRRTDMAVCASP